MKLNLLQFIRATVGAPVASHYLRALAENRYLRHLTLSLKKGGYLLLAIPLLPSLYLSTPGTTLADPIAPTLSVVRLKPKPLPQTHLEPVEPVQPVEVQVAPPPAPEPTAAGYSGSHEDWMAQAGISPADYTYVDFIVTHESTWGITAANPSGAYGLCQSLPGSKMASMGADWAVNPITQLRWCHGYAQSAYGGWYNAYLHWLSFRVW